MAEISQFVPRLPFDTLAQFEAASGLMFLNLDSQAFTQSGMNYANNSPTPEDIELYSTINHETYHYLQSIATGYQYAYASEVWRLIVAEANAQERREATKKKAEARAAPGLKRFMGVQELVENAQQAYRWEDAADGDLSVLTANYPSLARKFDDLW